MKLETIFDYKTPGGETIQYTAKGQIKKEKSYGREEGDIDISIGEAGDAFPCISIKYNFLNNDFRIKSLRMVPWGGSKDEEKVLCLNPPLEDRGSLDILVKLSLAIIYKLIQINEFNPEPTISINDKAFIDNYPLSLLKYKTKKDYINKTTYSKFGFQLRDSHEPNNFEQYITSDVPKYLNLPLSEVIEDKKEFLEELKRFNSVLTKKKRKIIEYNPSEKLGKFIEKVFETKLIKEYHNLLTILNKKYKFDIKGQWYLDKEFYDKIDKIVITHFNIY